MEVSYSAGINIRALPKTAPIMKLVERDAFVPILLAMRLILNRLMLQKLKLLSH